MKNSFVLYTDYMEQFELLNMEQRGILLTALMQYQMGDNLPEMDGITKMAFAFVKAQLDRDNEKYEETVKKRAESGAKGGRPKKTDASDTDEEKAKKANGFSEKQTEAKKPYNDNESDNVNDNDTKEKSKRKSVSFSPPTLEDVLRVSAEKNIPCDMDQAQAFIDYYTSNGWKVGKNTMKDWCAAWRNWVRRKDEFAKATPRPSKNRFNNFQGREYSNMDDLERALIER